MARPTDDEMRSAALALRTARHEFDLLACQGSNIDVQRARIRLNKIANDLLTGTAVDTAIKLLEDATDD